MRISLIAVTALIDATGCGARVSCNRPEDSPEWRQDSFGERSTAASPILERPLRAWPSPETIAHCGFETLDYAFKFWQGNAYLELYKRDSFAQIYFDPNHPLIVNNNDPGGLITVGFAQGVPNPTTGEIESVTIALALCDWRVIAHELGHALGLQHVEDANNIMYKELTAVDHPIVTEQQLAYVAAYSGE